MQDQTPGIVQTPSVDFVPYFKVFFNYIAVHFPDLVLFVKGTIGFLIAISIPLVVLFFILIIYTVEKLKMIRNKESEIYEAKADMGYSDVKTDDSPIAPETIRKWNKVLEQVESSNANDWRQAVIEADIMLGDLLSGLGYRGEGIGEQLKRATKADFKTLDDAWDAHKVRNELAHAGSEYLFNQFDARRVIQQFRKVFEEFNYVPKA